MKELSNLWLGVDSGYVFSKDLETLFEWDEI